jgi:ketosteroid isomerase-like protein
MYAEIARGYYRALDEGAHEEVASLFALDARYVRPEKVGAIERGAPKARELRESVGRDAIHDFAANAARVALERNTDVRHRIGAVDQLGHRVFVEGRVPSPDGGPDVLFFAHFDFDPATRLITRYVAVANETSPDLSRG